MEMKTFLTVLGWVGSKENKFWGLCIYSLGPPKSSLQNGEKTEERNLALILDKNAHVQLHIHPRCFSSHFCFSFFPMLTASLFFSLFSF